MKLLALALLSCARLPLPPSPDIDYCHQRGLVLAVDEWRGLCGQFIAPPPDGGGP